MQLSLQSSKRRKIDLSKRHNLIINEKLHMRENITYERFLELYNKYGESLEEYEFAKYYLDITSKKFYPLKSGKTKVTPILNLEYVSPQMIEEIKERVKKILDEKNKKKITKVELLEFYYKYGEYLSLKEFAEETMGITGHSVESLCCGDKDSVLIHNKESIDRELIREIQDRIAKEEHLHIDDEISFSEIQRLYQKFGNKFEEKIFATKVLQVSDNRYSFLRRKHKENDNKERKASIFSKYVVSSEYIETLREKVILNKKLHIGDEIDYKRFQELHQKYAGILSEDMFAEEILDVSSVGVKNMRTGNSNSIILTDIEIPIEYINELCEKVIKENNLEQEQFISREEFYDLYDKYGYVLSKKQFVSSILKVNPRTFETMDLGKNKSVQILKDYETTDFKKIREKIVKENNLHYSDRITYQEFLDLYKKYSPINLEEYIFVQKVMGIKIKSFYNMKYGTSKSVEVLLDEKLPTDQEIEDLKRRVIKENKLHYKDKINHEDFSYYHLKYGGIIPELMFAERILDLNKQSLKKIKSNSNDIVQILLKTRMNDEEIRKLKERIIEENPYLIEKAEITLEEFENLYNNYEHTLQQKDFAFYILGVNPQCLNTLKRKKCNIIRIFRNKSEITENEILKIKEFLIQGLSEKEIAKKMFLPLPFFRKSLKNILKNEVISKEEIQKERIRILYKEGKKLLEIRKLVTYIPEKVKEQLEEVREEERVRVRKFRKEQKKEATRKKKEQENNKNERIRQEREKSKRDKEFKEIKRKTERVLDSYIVNKPNRITVRKYISECKLKIENKSISKEDLEILKEVIIFLDSGEKDISLYVKGCIIFGEYTKAIKFINSTMDNEGVTSEGKIKLQFLKSDLKQAERESNAINIIYAGLSDPKQISERTGLTEVDAIRLMKKFKNQIKQSDKIQTFE